MIGTTTRAGSIDHLASDDPVLLAEDLSTIVEAARTGAEWAWAEVYRRFAPDVVRYLRAHGAAEPEDLLIEVFVGLLRSVSSFEGDAKSFRSWVFIMAHHRLIDERRRARRRPERVAPLEELDRPAAHDVAEDALERITTTSIARIIAALPAGQREVVLLRVLGGLTIQEVAQAVGKTPGAVKALQRRGFAAIKSSVAIEV